MTTSRGARCLRRHRGLQGLRAAAPVHRVRPRRDRGADGLRPGVRRRPHVGGAVRQAGLLGGVERRPRGAARADRPARRPRGGRPGDRRPAGEGRPRPGRRPAHQHAAHRALPGRLRAGDAHRDVGAPGHPGQRRDPAPARRGRDRARRGPPHRRRHRQGPAARPGRDLRAGPRRPRPRRRRVPRPGRSQGRRLRRRHPRVPRPGPLPRQPVLRPPGLRPRPGRRVAGSARHAGQRQRVAARPGRRQRRTRRDDRRSCATPSWPRPRPPTPW